MRVSWLLTLLLSAVLLLALPKPALAHEVSVVVVVLERGIGGSLIPTEVREGLRLAIDQSPDVGHAPGEDAGDHLGGVDLDLIELSATPEAALDWAFLAAADADAVIVAIIGSPDPSAVSGRDSDRLVLVLVDAVRGVAGGYEPTVILQSTSSIEPVIRGFTEAYGRDPTLSAALGYDLGQLMDVLIGETDGAPMDSAVIEGASSLVEDRLTVTSFVTLGGPPPQPVPLEAKSREVPNVSSETSSEDNEDPSASSEASGGDNGDPSASSDAFAVNSEAPNISVLVLAGGGIFAGLGLMLLLRLRTRVR